MLEPSPAILRIVHPRELRATIPLGADPVTLGRAPDDGSPALDHPTVSPCHARIAWEPPGHHAVRDAGSRTGTVVGGAPLGAATHALADGELVRVGDVLLIYQRAEAGAAPPRDLLDELDRRWLAWHAARGLAAAPLALAPAAAFVLLLSGAPDILDRLVDELAARGAAQVELGDLPRWLGAGRALATDPTTETPPVASPRPPRPPAPTRDELVAALAQLGSVRAVARHFGRDRRQVYRWLDAHGLRAPDGDD